MLPYARRAPASAACFSAIYFGLLFSFRVSSRQPVLDLIFSASIRAKADPERHEVLLESIEREAYWLSSSQFGHTSIGPFSKTWSERLVPGSRQPPQPTPEIEILRPAHSAVSRSPIPLSAVRMYHGRLCQFSSATRLALPFAAQSTTTNTCRRTSTSLTSRSATAGRGAQ